MFGTRYNSILARAIQPVRIIGIISLSAYVIQSNVSWDPSILFFYAFIPLYLSSFCIELVLTSLKGLRDNISSLGMKFFQMLPVEAAGVSGFALLTFAPHTNGTLLLAIETSIVIIVCWIGIEAYHKYLIPFMNGKKVTPQVAVLSVIGMTTATFLQGFYYLVLSPHHLVFIQ
ncbi:MAG TPA: hypothetical protein VJR22_06280 [Candidatus Nitrosotalea sp.]|nr:hypothetical protein [Candidatus Nitrosotalea sp.]